MESILVIIMHLFLEYFLVAISKGLGSCVGTQGGHVQKRSRYRGSGTGTASGIVEVYGIWCLVLGA